MRECAHTQAARRAHTRKLCTHMNFTSKNIFAHISYKSFQTLFLAQKTFYAHTNFEKLGGTLTPGTRYHLAEACWLLSGGRRSWHCQFRVNSVFNALSD